jgi:Zn-dependent protease with chaperone function
LTATAATSFAGPVDRVHFADEQRRYRRKSWRFTLFAALAVLTTGIPACIIVTPLIYAVVLLIAYIINVFAPLSPSAWTSLQRLAEAIPRAAASIDEGEALRNIGQIAQGAAVLVLPGALAMLALWIVVRGLVGRVGVGWALDRIGARALKTRDPEERQLGNLVEEIAVAAGVKPPRVLLIDTPEANAAITGLDLDDSTLLVTRGLLDSLDRDETQSVIAHLVGSVGNGDLKIASIIFSIYQTWGALAMLLNAPVERRSRKGVWRAFKVAFRSQTRAVDRWEAEFVSDALLRGASNDEPADPSDIGERVMSSSDSVNNANFLEKGYVFAALPLILGAQVVRFAIFISSMILVGPIISFMWRTRRHLADAMAVQLTRNPNSLVTALHKLSISQKSLVKGASGLGFLFVVWPGTVSSDASNAAVIGQFQRMHPKLHKRQRRLRALGATNVSDAQASGDRWTPGKTFGVLLLTLLIGPLMAIALGLSVVVLGMLTMLTLMMMMVLMFAIWGGLKMIFIIIPGWLARR